jgi:hypothetical protein
MDFFHNLFSRLRLGNSKSFCHGQDSLAGNTKQGFKVVNLFSSLIPACIIFLLCLVSVSALSWTEKEVVCESLNFSLGQCMEYWDMIENSQNCSIANVTECVECVNVTIERNCSADMDWQQAQWDQEFRMAQLDKGELVGDKIYTEDECSSKVAQAVSNYNPPVASSSEESFLRKNVWIIVMLCVLAYGIYHYKFKKRRPSRPVVAESPIPIAKPSDSLHAPVGESKSEKKQEGGSDGQGKDSKGV